MRNILLLLVIVSASAFAEDDKQYYFKPTSYQTGLHLLAGGGFNTSYYNSGSEGENVGIGINGKTDVGYYFTNRFAFEVSSNVKFNRVDGNLIWDTLFTLGFRYRFADSPYYARAFAGKAPTVVYTKNVPTVYSNKDAARIQFDGPVYGAAYGKMFETKKNRVWFLELMATYQALERATGVKNDGEVPVTLFKDSKENRAVIYSIYATIGLLVF